MYIDTSGYLVDGNGNFVLGVSGSNVGEIVDNQRLQLSVRRIAFDSVRHRDDKRITYTLSSSTALPKAMYPLHSFPTTLAGRNEGKG